MSEGLLSVAEVNEEGSVPELKVTNAADMSVLLLDGEELMGAKQNRVLNTSILLVVKSETIIPVSCTEHGRWSYSSPAFSDSGVVMSPSLRMRKVSSVSTSLERIRGLQFEPSGKSGTEWHGCPRLRGCARRPARCVTLTEPEGRILTRTFELLKPSRDRRVSWR